MRKFVLRMLCQVVCVGVCAGAGAAQTGTPPSFEDLAARVQNYMLMREQVESSLPAQKSTKQSEQLVARQKAFAQKIREARASAKQGDIFSPGISAKYRQVIQTAFQGPNARYVRKTIREGAPVKGWSPRVNGDYPDDVPLTTVPPTLLLRLPQLPKQLAYRIVGRDFVLQDADARIVVDYIPGALSQKDVP